MLACSKKPISIIIITLILSREINYLYVRALPEKLCLPWFLLGKLVSYGGFPFAVRLFNMCKLKFAAIEHKYSTSFFKLNTINIQISALKSKISAAKLADSSHSPCDSGLIVDTDNDLSICQPYVE